MQFVLSHFVYCKTPSFSTRVDFEWTQLEYGGRKLGFIKSFGGGMLGTDGGSWFKEQLRSSCWRTGGARVTWWRGPCGLTGWPELVPVHGLPPAARLGETCGLVDGLGRPVGGLFGTAIATMGLPLSPSPCGAGRVSESQITATGRRVPRQWKDTSHLPT